MNYPTKKLLVLLSIVLFSVACSGNNPSPTQNTKPVYDYSHKLKIGEEILFVEIVSDEKKMQTGLSNLPNMNDNNGMLFDFGNKKVTPNFWMKDMLFDIDLIWIYKNKIVEITPDVTAPAKDEGLNIKNLKLPTYSPANAATRVLEVNAGWSKTNNIKVGDKIELVN
ncbi:MAG: DUF192 domain-containing protein [Patescibacteria group bacterium]